MKALILNSGTGSRLGSNKTCKCLAELSDDVTILDLQLTALIRCGISDIYITTGRNADVLENYIRANYPREKYPQAEFTFIHNPLYESTNYIYSMYLAREYLSDDNGDDMLLLHGDLVFEQNVLQDIISANGSVMAVDSFKPLPEKDFKAQVSDGIITAVGVDIFDNALYAQPLYKLTREAWDIWAAEIKAFCNAGNTGVYAEKALNKVSGKAEIKPLDITGRICFEVDTDEDLAAAREAYMQMPDKLQEIYAGGDICNIVKSILKENNSKKPFIVCGSGMGIAKKLFEAEPGCDPVYFSNYTANPDTADIDKGREILEREGCDLLVSAGGGSAIDTAKYIKYTAGRENETGVSYKNIKHLTIPTSAGTGSESTSIAVVYRDGTKESVEDESLMPDHVILDAALLQTLPEYHKKSAMLDAYCQATESLWAKRRTAQSEAYARAARALIYENAEGYLSGNKGCAGRMLNAANLSGKAINISRTTAAHAMSYKISTLLGYAHGHAVAACLIPVWEDLINKGCVSEELNDKEFKRYKEFFNKLDMSMDFGVYSGGIDALAHELTAEVNIERLGNHATGLDTDEIYMMYLKITGAENTKYI